MHVLILGRGKTGSLVAEVAAERRHHVQAVGSEGNLGGAALTPETLQRVDMIIDFTTPLAVVANIRACAAAGKSMVVGTTGWYGRAGDVKGLVEAAGTGLVYGANFSVGVNLFFEMARAAGAALQHGYHGQIFERHHIHKKDAPSGTAVKLQNVMAEAAGGQQLEVVSFREGEVVGLHEVVLESSADRIYLCHDAKSRRGFAEGAVRAAEWLAGKRGFYDFKDVWRDL
jgi:4-hydroxy-tetrahydrodipicolinate reductase